MNFKLVASLISFEIYLVFGENVNSSEISQTQLSSLHKFTILRSSYEIPDDISLLDFCKTYRNKTPDEVEITSENYPKPYPENKLKEFIFSVNNGSGIEIILCDLDINPHSELLKLSSINEDGIQSSGIIFTGKLKKPLNLRLLQFSKAKLEFKSAARSTINYRGFLLIYFPFYNNSEPVASYPQKTIEFDKLQTYNAYLMVSNQSTDTWEIFRELLCNSSNQFINKSNLALENCHKNNVTIKEITKCPDQWPNSKNCIDFSFAISLYALEDDDVALNPILLQTRDPSGLTKEQLEKIWSTYGKYIFLKNGYKEYEVPNAKNKVLLWIGIGFGFVLVCLIILFGMFRLTTFRDYWPPLDDDKQNILKSLPDIDVSMFPSPDQVVPPLFPAGAGGYNNEVRENFYNAEEKKKQNNEIINKKNSTGYGALNQGFVDDEDQVRKRPNYQTYVKGVNTDEIVT